MQYVINTEAQASCKSIHLSNCNVIYVEKPLHQNLKSSSRSQNRIALAEIACR
jgi:hypothetical protein